MRVFIITTSLILSACQSSPRSSAAIEVPADTNVQYRVDCRHNAVAPDEGYNVDLRLVAMFDDSGWIGSGCEVLDHDEGDTIYSGNGTGSGDCTFPYRLMINDVTPEDLGLFTVSFGEDLTPSIHYESYDHPVYGHADDGYEYDYAFLESECTASVVEE